MKIFVGFAVLLALLGIPQGGWPQELQTADWDIYFEPTAKLQTGAPIPFQITVNDSLHKPLVDAKVTLQIETPDRQKVEVFKAPAIDKGVYIAKPVFPSPGQWDVLVDVRRDNRENARTIQYNVPR